MGTYRRLRNNSVLFRILKKLILFLTFFVLPFCLLWFGFSIRQVEVAGAQHYDPEQIKKMVFNTSLDSNSLYLYLKYNYLPQPKHPFIERIDIRLQKPGYVKLNVYEKMVAGCVEMMGEYFYFDKDGIVVESSPVKLDKVPLIKGLKFNEIILYEKLSIKKERLYIPYEELSAMEADGDAAVASSAGNKKGNSQESTANDYIYDTIIKLTQLIDKYNINVDTVIFNSNYEITLECGSVTVLLGKKSTYDETLSELGNIMKEVEGMEITIDMDNRLKETGGIIAKPKK